MKKVLIAVYLFLSFGLVAENCELPLEYTGGPTGANMTVLLNASFISNLSFETTTPYIVALAANDLVVGSASLATVDLSNGMQSIAIWGDDVITEEIDGALPSENIELNIVDGINLYTVTGVSIVYTTNSVQVVESGAMEFICAGEIFGCVDETACNYNSVATQDDGSCLYPEQYYDCDGNCLSDIDADGVCDELEIIGCIEPMACNYNFEATEEGECVYPELYYDCDGNCIIDTDGDGICDQLEVAGCMEYFACNYLPEATDDDGSCVIIEAEIGYDELNGVLSLQTNADSVEITWLYYDNVIPQEHNDTLFILDDGIYGVVVFDPINDCGASDTVHVNVVGLNDDLTSKVNLFPNPTTSILNVELDAEADVFIFNSMGELMYNSNLKKESISVVDYPAGMYFLKVVHRNSSSVHPWFKN